MNDFFLVRKAQKALHQQTIDKSLHYVNVNVYQKEWQPDIFEGARKTQ